MTRLSDKSHWDHVHETASFTFQESLNRFPIFRFFSLGFSNWEFFHLVKKHLHGKELNTFEIGCAPGNYLVKFHQLFGLSPAGIEYSDAGVEVLKQNFSKNHIDAELIHGDFFDDSLIEKNKEKFDIVYSLGFIEHFDDPSDCIKRHFELTKKWGMVVVVIPNLQHLGGVLTEENVLAIHNRNIMHLDVFKNFFKGYAIEEARYFWGFFNTGLYFYKNPILEKIRFIFFLFQRFILDPISWLLYKIGINLSNKYTSPSLIVIARKD